MCMNIGSYEGIAYTHRIHNRFYIVYSCCIELVFHCIIEQTTQGVMTAGYLISHRHHHLLALREELVHLAEILQISLLINFIVLIQSLERNVRHTTGHLPLVLVTKDDVAILHHLEEHIVRFQAISPEILAIVDIAGYGQAISHSQLDGIHGRFHGITADGTGDARTMEYGCICQYLIPFHHALLQGIERRILAVIDHARIAHCHSLLEIISSKTVATTHHMRNIQTILSEVHQRSLSHLAIRQAGNILHVIAQISQRDGRICLTATIVSKHTVTLE